MMVLVISRSHRGQGVYRRLILPVLLLVGVSFLGFALVVLSESGLGASGPLVSWRTLLGVFLSLLCGTVAGLHGFLLAWSRDLSGTCVRWAVRSIPTCASWRSTRLPSSW